MNARRLIALYPRTWRERYGEEVIALVDESRLSGLGAFDLFVGAGREWIRLAAQKLSGRKADRSPAWAMNCPNCKTSIGLESWLQMKMRSGPVAGRLVRECATCGALVRLTQSWSVAHTLSNAVLLILILTDISFTHLSRAIFWGRAVAMAIVYIAWLVASRSVRLEIVPLDYGESR